MSRYKISQNTNKEGKYFEMYLSGRLPQITFLHKQIQREKKKLKCLPLKKGKCVQSKTRETRRTWETHFVNQK